MMINKSMREHWVRNSISGTVIIHGHAIDRASTRLFNKWLSTRRKDEGIYKWLRRNFRTAIRCGEWTDNQVTHDGIIYTAPSEAGVYRLVTVYSTDKHDK